MPAKKAKKPTPSVRYLLSGDRRLQRLSLRKMADRPKKATPQRRATRSKSPSPAADSGLAPWPGPRAIVLLIVGVVAAATLIAASQPSGQVDAAGTTPPPVAHTAPEQAASLPRVEAKTAFAPKSPAPPAAPRMAAADLPTRKSPALKVVKAPAVDATTKPGVAPSKAVAPESKAMEVAGVPAVTVTGCLESDGQRFRLNDTSGADAPRSRSWRFGFLKRRATTIELVDSGYALKLATHVGKRIAATGTLANRELQARSVRLVSDSCN